MTQAQTTQSGGLCGRKERVCVVVFNRRKRWTPLLPVSHCARTLSMAVDYGIKPSDDGRFEIVWKSAKTAPTTDEVETEIAEAPANQPAAASPTEDASQHAPAATELATTDAAPQPASELEVASQPAPAATEPAPALSEPAPKNEWPPGTPSTL